MLGVAGYARPSTSPQDPDSPTRTPPHGTRIRPPEHHHTGPGFARPSTSTRDPDSPVGAHPLLSRVLLSRDIPTGAGFPPERIPARRGFARPRTSARERFCPPGAHPPRERVIPAGAGFCPTGAHPRRAGFARLRLERRSRLSAATHLDRHQVYPASDFPMVRSIPKAPRAHSHRSMPVIPPPPCARGAYVE
jgi:hypothetical protein